MFKYESQEVIDKMSAEEFDKYQADKRAFEANEVSKQVKEEVEKATKEMKDVISKNELEIKALNEKGVDNSVSNKMFSEIKENLETIKSFAVNKKDGEVVIKALTNRASVANNEQAYDLPDIGQLATRKLTALDVFPKFNLTGSNHNGTIRYYDWDSATTVRASAMVAEGSAFPESTAKWAKYTLDLKKVGDTLPMTEEFLEDESMFAGELQMFLTVNVDVKIDDQLINGDGTGENLTGLIASINAFDATPYAGTIQAPTIYDLIVKVSESITKVGGSKYSPDIALMNISMINKYRLSKDLRNNYILPPFVSADGKSISGITVIECNAMGDDELVVCDRRFARIYQMPGVAISKGHVGTQFTEDEITIKARKRLLFLVRNADKGGFAKVTSIDADLTELQAV